jgi:hypothetical protein
MILSGIRYFGALRAVLAILVLAMAVTGPVADVHGSVRGWGLYVNVIAPAFSMILLFILPLDMIMTRVFMNNSEHADGQRRYRHILWAEIGLLLTLLAAWLPFVVVAIQQG